MKKGHRLVAAANGELGAVSAPAHAESCQTHASNDLNIATKMLLVRLLMLLTAELLVQQVVLYVL